jgi:tetratricopeptide (TPR) repeat protein
MKLGSRALACVFVLGSSYLHAMAAHAQAPESDSEVEVSRDEQIARERFRLGRIHYDNGEFVEAADNFEEAYRLSKREVLWYNIYLAHRDSGNNAKAAEALRMYLSRVEAVENRAQLEARLVNLEKLVKSEVEDKARRDELARQRAVEPSEQTLSAASSHADEPERSFVPYLVLGGGAALVVGGVVAGSMAKSRFDEIEEQCPKRENCDPSLKATRDSGETLALISPILWGVGAGVVATGAVLWVLDWRKTRESSGPSRVAGSLGCGSNGCLGNLKLRF